MIRPITIQEALEFEPVCVSCKRTAVAVLETGVRLQTGKPDQNDPYFICGEAAEGRQCQEPSG